MKESKECRIVSSASALYDASMNMSRFGGFTVFAGVAVAPIRHQPGTNVFIIHVFHFIFIIYYINAFYIYFFTSLSDREL